MNNIRIFAIILTLIFAAAAGYVNGGEHGTVFYGLVAATAIVWKFVSLANILAIVLTLILGIMAGYVSGGEHGAFWGALVTAAWICWKLIGPTPSV